MICDTSTTSHFVFGIELTQNEKRILEKTLQKTKFSKTQNFVKSALIFFYEDKGKAYNRFYLGIECSRTKILSRKEIQSIKEFFQELKLKNMNMGYFNFFSDEKYLSESHS